jgi:formate dehydrogenase (NADP+) beta subunit
MAKMLFNSWGPGTGKSKETPMVPADLLDGREIKAFMGWDGLLVRDKKVNIVDMTREYMERTQDESCGQCTPCRIGTVVMMKLLNKICAGEGTLEDLTQLEWLAKQVMTSSMCEIGQTTPVPVLHAIENFRKEFEKVIKNKKPVLKGDYIAKVTAPCQSACPSHVNIPAYVEHIKKGRFEDALEVVKNDCCMPGTIGRVCVRPCEFNCRRGLVDGPISIKYLKRFIADYELGLRKSETCEMSSPQKDKVAIIGAGPAGLSCAYYLGLQGYRCTIFESLPEPGGMAAVGIPDYRLPRDILRGEVEMIEKLGGEIRYNTHVGRDISFNDIKAQGFRAVFIGSGSHDSSSMRCEGEDEGYDGFMPGVEYLRKAALGEQPLDGKKFVAIGGGNVAIDCVRSALRLGFDDVHIVYRRTEKEMPADQVEIDDAREEKINFNFLTQPIKILAENNVVTGLECLRMELGEPDESGRRRPVPVDGSNFIIEADAVVPAIGQMTVLDYLDDEPGIETTPWKNTIIVDDHTLKVSDKPIFAGGDCKSGPLTLIAALAAGKNSARHIAEYIETGECSPDENEMMENVFEKISVYDPDEKMKIVGGTPGIHLKMLDPDERISSFDEVEAGMSFEEAMKEASRCLRCFRLGLAAV